jgi:hypothetical protein
MVLVGLFELRIVPSRTDKHDEATSTSAAQNCVEIV